MRTHLRPDAFAARLACGCSLPARRRQQRGRGSRAGRPTPARPTLFAPLLVRCLSSAGPAPLPQARPPSLPARPRGADACCFEMLTARLDAVRRRRVCAPGPERGVLARVGLCKSRRFALTLTTTQQLCRNPTARSPRMEEAGRRRRAPTGGCLLLTMSVAPHSTGAADVCWPTPRAAACSRLSCWHRYSKRDRDFQTAIISNQVALAAQPPSASAYKRCSRRTSPHLLSTRAHSRLPTATLSMAGCGWRALSLRFPCAGFVVCEGARVPAPDLSALRACRSAKSESYSPAASPSLGFQRSGVSVPPFAPGATSRLSPLAPRLSHSLHGRHGASALYP